MVFNPDNPTEHTELADLADHAYDDFDEAMTEVPKRYFGEVTYLAPARVTVHHGTINYATGAFSYDENMPKWERVINNPDAWAIAEKVNAEARSRKDKKSQGIFNSKEIEFNIMPLDPSFTIVERSFPINKSGWQQIVRPSLKALEERVAEVKSLAPGQFNMLNELLHLFVEYEAVPDPGNKPSQTYTVFHFLNVYATREECQAAADAYFNGGYAGDEPDEVPDEQSAENATKAALIPFLYPLWEQAKKQAEGNDTFNATDIMAGLLKVNPLLAEVFTMESPEVLALTTSETQETSGNG
jgi:hypothetical protein